MTASRDTDLSSLSLTTLQASLRMAPKPLRQVRDKTRTRTTTSPDRHSRGDKDMDRGGDGPKVRKLVSI